MYRLFTYVPKQKLIFFLNFLIRGFPINVHQIHILIKLFCLLISIYFAILCQLISDNKVACKLTKLQVWYVLRVFTVVNNDPDLCGTHKIHHSAQLLSGVCYVCRRKHSVCVLSVDYLIRNDLSWTELLLGTYCIICRCH